MMRGDEGGETGERVPVKNLGVRSIVEVTNGVQCLRALQGLQADHQWPPDPRGAGDVALPRGHMGPEIREHVDVHAAKARMSRRNFLGTASGFAAAMLAVNEITA